MKRELEIRNVLLIVVLIGMMTTFTTSRDIMIFHANQNKSVDNIVKLI